MNTLAINFNHDGAVVVFREGKLAGYVNTERFSRKRKHPGVRAFDIEEVLSQAGLKLGDIGSVQLVNLNNMDTSDIGRLHGISLKETSPEFWINNATIVISKIWHRNSLRRETPKPTIAMSLRYRSATGQTSKTM